MRDMPAPKSDPTFIPNKERYFIDLAKQVATGSNHPIAAGGCVIIRDREIVGDGRSVLADCKVEIDCVTYAIATACKRAHQSLVRLSIPLDIHSLHLSFSCTLMGIRKVVVLAHEWEPYYKDEFRRAARLAREISRSIEPFFEDDDERFATNNQAPRFDDREEQFKNKDLYTHSPAESDGISPETYDEQINDSNNPSL